VNDLPTIVCRGPVPFQKPMYFVVGKPINVTKNPSPTNEEVRQLAVSVGELLALSLNFLMY
jgi:RNase H-fold protein (predicted Holliday junction resolvase)